MRPIIARLVPFIFESMVAKKCSCNARTMQSARKRPLCDADARNLFYVLRSCECSWDRATMRLVVRPCVPSYEYNKIPLHRCYSDYHYLVGALDQVGQAFHFPNYFLVTYGWKFEHQMTNLITNINPNWLVV